MIFTEFRFLFFFVIVFCAYWALAQHKHRKFWLLICSYIFYGAWDWRFLSLMLISTVIDYIVGLMLVRPTEEDILDASTQTSPPHTQSTLPKVAEVAESQNQQPEIYQNHVSANPEKLLGWQSWLWKIWSWSAWWDSICAKPLKPQHRQQWLMVSLLGNLGILGFFKYYNFFVDSGSNFLTFLGLPFSVSSLQIILPVGISFYTFQTLSYSLDINRGKLKPIENFWDFALFVSFFPQLVAGPIVRASIFLPQLPATKRFEDVDVRGCLMLFLGGYIKKACISDNLSPFVGQYFANPEQYDLATAWVAGIFLAIQVYCDFSGYSDMAIATAGLLGYKLPRNFNFPYLASSITELWKRWHITMSNWFRDYLYVPLMQKRIKKDRTPLFSYRNLMFTMLLTGLWHGAAWHFVVWGGLNGMALVVHREWSNRIANHETLKAISSLVGLPLTFYWFCASGVFFGSQDLYSGWVSFKAFIFFQAPGVGSLDARAIWVLVPLGVMHWLNQRGWLSNWWRQVPAWSFAACYGTFTAAVLPATAIVYQPFVYFQF
jgi:alginate O-acetyltransferase complex protein AlgI